MEAPGDREDRPGTLPAPPEGALGDRDLPLSYGTGSGEHSGDGIFTSRSRDQQFQSPRVRPSGSQLIAKKVKGTGPSGSLSGWLWALVL